MRPFSKRSKVKLSGLAFSPDGSLLAVATRDRTVALYRMQHRPSGRNSTERGHPAAVAPPAKTVTHLTKEIEVAWSDLAGTDAMKAYHAIWALAGQPEEAVTLLGKHLRPVPGIAGERLSRLVGELDSDRFESRERSTHELGQLEELAETALRRALEGRPGPEQRRRAERLLAQLDRPLAAGEKLRQVRAVEALELIGTDEARRLLKRLGSGAPEARLTREAQASLGRLERRANPGR